METSLPPYPDSAADNLPATDDETKQSRHPGRLLPQSTVLSERRTISITGAHEAKIDLASLFASGGCACSRKGTLWKLRRSPSAQRVPAINNSTVTAPIQSASWPCKHPDERNNIAKIGPIPTTGRTDPAPLSGQSGQANAHAGVSLNTDERSSINSDLGRRPNAANAPATHMRPSPQSGQTKGSSSRNEFSHSPSSSVGGADDSNEQSRIIRAMH